LSTENTKTSDYDDTPEGWAQRWQLELKKAKEALADFYTVAEAADDAVRDTAKDNGGKRLCLWAATNQVVGAMLFGRTPQASVSRKFADAKDDKARVASSMMERVLNCDIQREDDTFSEATRNAMRDWLNAGLGVEWHRYEMGEVETTPGEPEKVDPLTGAVMAPAVPAQETRPNERVDTDYVHWRDFLWDPSARVWHEVPWVARKAKMSREAGLKLFGDEFSEVPLNAKHAKPGEPGGDAEKLHPWDRAEVWEIWHRDSHQVFFVVEGYRKVLTPKDLPAGDQPGQVSKNGGLNNPLGLTGYYPCQKPMMDVPSTSKLIPVPKFKYVQDLLNSIDTLTTRIHKLTAAVAVKGGYAKELGAQVQKIIQGTENELVPVEEWAMFAEKGGLAGAIVYLPLEQIVSTLTVLNNQRQGDMELLYQVTGQSDLTRGQQTANGTPGEAKIKAKSASVRIQSMQDEIARFASEGQRIRAEIVAKHFDPKTIVRHSNVEQTPDAGLAQAAVQLIQSRLADYRIEIKPEAINLTDFTALKEERVEVMSAVGAFFQQAAPVMQLGPMGMKFALQMLQVTLAGLKGASAYESIIDQAIAEVVQAQKQAAANPPQQAPDPKVIAQQMKGQQDMAKVQAELQADLIRTDADVQADAMREQNQMEWNVKEHAAKTQITNAMKPPPAPGMGGRPAP
jgi:hypothetical protein